MISAFQSRDTGWGIKISKQQLIEINKQREGNHYFDRDAATDIHGTTEKGHLLNHHLSEHLSLEVIMVTGLEVTQLFKQKTVLIV